MFIHQVITYRSILIDNTREASSKADIFEAKVANAVSEANSSDSDETYVYESNPPESQSRGERHHSRTPSATSGQSSADYRAGMRSIDNLLNSHRGITGKRSLKFSNNPYNSSGLDSESGERLDGTFRGSSRGSGSGSQNHHHIGRFGRIGSHHHSLFGTDSPFSPESKLRTATEPDSPRQGPATNSPKTGKPHHLRLAGSGSNHGRGTQYDFDGDGADDESTPLMSTVHRTPRARGAKRPLSSYIRDSGYYEHRQRSCLARFAGCITMGVVVLLAVLAAVGFLFATTQPLYKLEVKEIKNVLASEQEIMLDLLVSATNPNIFAVTVSDMDVNVFAKSKHVGTDRLWREHGRSRQRGLRRERRRPSLWPSDNVDEGTDPIDDPESDAQTMLLGRILQFDSALSFASSPLKRHRHTSTGEVRLERPGNQTEAGGTERWERVLQYPFELIIRGVLKYELPLSSRVRSASIGASVLVRPEKGV